MFIYFLRGICIVYLILTLYWLGYKYMRVELHSNGWAVFKAIILFIFHCIMVGICSYFLLTLN